MPTYRLTLEYDGSDFAGSQVQPGRRTVTGVLTEALRAVTQEAPRLTFAGRTDAGAHAHGQVAGATLRRAWDPQRLAAALNATLPVDVAVVAAEPVHDGFDARREAVDRTYQYAVLVRDTPAPVSRRHAWTVRGPLHLERMRQAAELLVGTHDFAAFGGATRPGGSTVRTVHDVTITPVTLTYEDGRALSALIIGVRADAFLRGMMRTFAGALVKVGQGAAPVGWIDQLLQTRERSSRITLAPAHGLHQWAVRYDVSRPRMAA